ncbi:hypothetical protein ACFUJU_13400 [Streptomyces sp. NPDC057235]|uniref:hypothetical protein n=1 Tax=Streptomyces sp. NPDC057235 TaxID=3346058 RepID=UPI003635BDF3
MKTVLLRQVRRRLGRRGIYLLIAGVGKICWGVSFLVQDPPGVEGLKLLTDFCGLRHWAWLWIVCGLATSVAAFLRIGRDRIGFITALAPPHSVGNRLCGRGC